MSNDDTNEATSDSPTVGGHQIQAVQDDDVENILGWTVVYTIGPYWTVDRQWLEERAAELGIDHKHLPSETTSKAAYTRACKRLDRHELGAASHPAVDVETVREDRNTFNVELVDRRGDDVIHEVIGEIEYVDKSAVSTPKTEEKEYVETFLEYSKQAQQLHELHQTSNTGVDIRTMIREFAKHPSSAGVKMRDAGAVYFVPRQAGDTLLAMKQLVEEINETWKTSGYEAAVDTIEVIDSADKREMVERKVRKTLDSVVESALDAAFDELDEETAAQDVIGEVGEDLVRAENVAAEHNALLDVELSVEETLAGWKDRVSSEDKEELVEAAIEEVDL